MTSLTLGLLLADMPTAHAQAPAPAPAGQVEGPAPAPAPVQLATQAPRRPRRPPLDPAARELRTARGILAGGIVFTALCSAGFVAWTVAIARIDRPIQGAGADRLILAGPILLGCTIASVAGIGVGARRVRALRSSGRVAWTGGLGLRF